MPVVSSSMHLFATPLLYTQFGMVSYNAPAISLAYQDVWQGNSLHVLLTAAFAAFVLVLFGHRLTFPIHESHESSFQFVSICSPPL
jgi:hypothetical protein